MKQFVSLTTFTPDRLKASRSVTLWFVDLFSMPSVFRDFKTPMCSKNNLVLKLNMTTHNADNFVLGSIYSQRKKFCMLPCPVDSERNSKELSAVVNTKKSTRAKILLFCWDSRQIVDRTMTRCSLTFTRTVQKPWPECGIHFSCCGYWKMMEISTTFVHWAAIGFCVSNCWQ